MTYITDILKEVGVPEKEWWMNVSLEEEHTIVTNGICDEFHHGYKEWFRTYDPYNQLQQESLYNPSAFVDDYKIKYKGEKPAAILHYMVSQTHSNGGFDVIRLFLPERETVIMESKQMDEIEYRLPFNLLKKWLAKEFYPLAAWGDYCDSDGYYDEDIAFEKQEKEKKIGDKARLYAAYKFAKEYPQKIGVMHDVWNEYWVDGGQLRYSGTSILVNCGKVEFVSYEETKPEELLKQYNAKEFYPINVSIPETRTFLWGL